MANNIALLAIATTLTIAITGCAKEEGPMEKMGKSLDDAAHSVEKSAEEAADSVKEAVNE
jgi:hypothetical protein